MTSRNFITAVACLLLLSSACQKTGSNQAPVQDLSQVPADHATSAVASESENAEYTEEQANLPAHPKKLIKNATLSIEVRNLKQSTIDIKRLLEKYHASIESEQYLQHYNRTEQQWTIRSKPEQLDALMEELVAIGVRIETRASQVQDVTRGYIDIETRLRTKQEVLQQYQVLLKRATKIEEILKIQEHLRIVTEEIESSKAQLKSWDQEVQLATLQLVLFQEHSSPVADQRGYFSQAFGRLVEGWTYLESFTLVLLGWWPFFGFAGLAFYLWKRFKR
jgi:hypothetical protein